MRNMATRYVVLVRSFRLIGALAWVLHVAVRAFESISSMTGWF